MKSKKIISVPFMALGLLIFAGLYDVSVAALKSKNPNFIIPLLKVFVSQKYATFWDGAMILEIEKIEKSPKNDRV